MVPRNILYGQKDKKLATNAVQVIIDCASINIVHELMIELFQMKPDDILADVCFVPSPTPGVMNHELFYNHLHLHHQYMANLHSFGITNIHDLQAERTLLQADGMTKMTTFEKALLKSVRLDTQTQLFKSIEPTKDMEKYGKYLLIMIVNLLEDAQTCLNQALKHMSVNTPENMSWITTMTDGFSVTHTNCITMSTRFHSYAQALQNMILVTIMTTILSNA